MEFSVEGPGEVIRAGEIQLLRCGGEDPDGDALRYTLRVEPDVGVLEPLGNGDGRYQLVDPPLLFREQTLHFHCTVSDDDGEDTATVTRPALGNVVASDGGGAIVVFDSAGTHLGDLVGREGNGRGEGLLELDDGRWLHLQRGYNDIESAIVVYAASGQELARWGQGRGPDGELLLDDPRRLVAFAPDWILVSDDGHNRISAFRIDDGSFDGVFYQGENYDDFADMRWHSNGELWVTESFSGSVFRFSATGDKLGEFGVSLLDSPLGIIELPGGDVLISDDDENRIMRFRANGAAHARPFAFSPSRTQTLSDLTIVGDFLLVSGRNFGRIQAYQLAEDLHPDDRLIGNWSERFLDPLAYQGVGDLVYLR